MAGVGHALAISEGRTATGLQATIQPAHPEVKGRKAEVLLLEQIREAVTQHVERSSVRNVAALIRISKGAVHGFIHGTKPHARILQKLREWYCSLRVESGEAHTSEGDEAPATSAVPSVEQVRRALRASVKKSSLQIVALESGVSRSSLHSIIHGAGAHRRTWDVLFVWYRSRYPIATTGKKRTKPRRAPDSAHGLLEDIRELATQHVERSSIRFVASQIGISKAAMHKFIGSTNNPQERTRRKLLNWYNSRPGEEDTRYRQVAVAQLQAWVVKRLERQGLRPVAREVGLSTATIAAFVNRSRSPRMRTRRAIALAYLQEQDR